MHLIWVLSLSIVSAVSLDRQLSVNLFCSSPSHHLMGIYWPTPRTKPGQAMQNRHTLTNHHISCSTSLAPAPKFPNLLHGPQSNHCPVRGYLGQVGDLSVVHSHGAKVLQKQLTAKAGTPACELLWATVVAFLQHFSFLPFLALPQPFLIPAWGHTFAVDTRSSWHVSHLPCLKEDLRGLF